MSIKVANGSIVHHMATKGNQLQCRRLCQKIGLEGLFKKCPITLQECFRPLVFIKLQIEAKFSIWEPKATNYNASACAKNLGRKDFQRCPMTFPTMFQASSVYKSCVG